MSEIYDALKKISGSKQSHHAEESPKKISGNVIVFRQFFRSPAGIFTLVLLIFAFIGFCSLGAYMFLDYLAPQVKHEGTTEIQPQEAAPFPASDADPGAPSPENTMNHLEEIPELPADEIFFTEMAEPAPAVTHLTFNDEQKSSPYVAKRDTNTGSSSLSPQPTQATLSQGTTPSAHISETNSDNDFSRPGTVTPRETMGYTLTESASLPPIEQSTLPMETNRLSLSKQTAPSNGFHGLGDKAISNRESTSFSQTSWGNSVETTTRNFTRKQTTLEHESFEPSGKIYATEVDQPPREEPPSQSQLLPASHEVKTTTGSRDILTQRSEKGAKITLLVAQLEQLLSLGKTTEAEHKLLKIENYLGQNSSYLLKMRAFFHMKQNQNQEATSFLQQVLARDENDLEAGINMAILDIISNNTDAAVRRLEKLDEVYPGNLHIQRLLEKTH